MWQNAILPKKEDSCFYTKLIFANKDILHTNNMCWLSMFWVIKTLSLWKGNRNDMEIILNPNRNYYLIDMLMGQFLFQLFHPTLFMTCLNIIKESFIIQNQIELKKSTRKLFMFNSIYFISFILISQTWKYFMRHNHDNIEDAIDNDDEPTFDENAAKRLKWK